MTEPMERRTCGPRAGWGGPCRPARAVAAALALLVASGPVDAGSSLEATEDLRRAVTADGVFRHLETFQAIADRNGGHRAAGSAGYDQSAAYVAQRLRAAGYEVEFQAFDFPYFEELAAPTLAAETKAGGAPEIGAVRTLAYSGSGQVTASLQPVDLGMAPGEPPGPSTSGCEAADFEGFEPGRIALIRRGTCTFQTKVENAAAAGAAGVVIFNHGLGDAVGPFRGRLAEPADIPAVAVDYASGERLFAATRAGPVEVRLTVEARSGWRATRNVIAELPRRQEPEGDELETILVGAHLDGVAAGPGLNDNASGAAVVLETALQLAALGIVPDHRIRFAFWGAEEVGLVGSRHYVDSLSAAERKRIVAVLNFDMLGSPNYGRYVYDGDGSGGDSRRPPPGSAAIERVFLDYFEAVGLAAAPTDIRAGSDHLPFAAAGIAIGGLYAGSLETKTDEQAALFGGVAGRPHDPCYHRACDTVESISRRAIDELSDAAAHAILTLALKPATGA